MTISLGGTDSPNLHIRQTISLVSSFTENKMDSLDGCVYNGNMLLLSNNLQFYPKGLLSETL